jgi:hypothetical protein
MLSGQARKRGPLLLEQVQLFLIGHPGFPPFFIADRAHALTRNASVRLKKALAGPLGGDLGKAKAACAAAPCSQAASGVFWHMLASAGLLVICSTASSFGGWGTWHPQGMPLHFSAPMKLDTIVGAN